VFITTHQAGSTDTVLYVRDCRCTGTEVACNDDADGRSTSMLRLTALPAGTYNVFVDTKTSTSGSIPLDIYISDPGTESDRCGNPTFITPGTSTLTGDTCGYTADYVPTIDVECDFPGFGAGWDRVYYFYLPTAATVSFDGCGLGSVYDTTVFVRDVCSSGSASNQIACNDDNCPPDASYCAGEFVSSLSTSLMPGLYYFFADGWGVDPVCSCGVFEYGVGGI